MGAFLPSKQYDAYIKQLNQQKSKRVMLLLSHRLVSMCSITFAVVVVWFNLCHCHDCRPYQIKSKLLSLSAWNAGYETYKIKMIKYNKKNNKRHFISLCSRESNRTLWRILRSLKSKFSSCFSWMRWQIGLQQSGSGRSICLNNFWQSGSRLSAMVCIYVDFPTKIVIKTFDKAISNTICTFSKEFECSIVRLVCQASAAYSRTGRTIA